MTRIALVLGMTLTTMAGGCGSDEDAAAEPTDETYTTAPDETTGGEEPGSEQGAAEGLPVTGQ